MPGSKNELRPEHWGACLERGSSVTGAGHAGRVGIYSQSVGEGGGTYGAVWAQAHFCPGRMTQSLNLSILVNGEASLRGSAGGWWPGWGWMDIYAQNAGTALHRPHTVPTLAHSSLGEQREGGQETLIFPLWRKWPRSHWREQQLRS